MTLMKLLKATDWGQTPVYYQFLRNGRWKHEDDNIYSEVELRYNMALVKKQIHNLASDIEDTEINRED